MNTPNVDAGRLERRVRQVGRETMPGLFGFCFLPFISLWPALVAEKEIS